MTESQDYRFLKIMIKNLDLQLLILQVFFYTRFCVISWIFLSYMFLTNWDFPEFSTLAEHHTGRTIVAYEFFYRQSFGNQRLS